MGKTFKALRDIGRCYSKLTDHPSKKRPDGKKCEQTCHRDRWKKRRRVHLVRTILSLNTLISGRAINYDVRFSPAVYKWALSFLMPPPPRRLLSVCRSVSQLDSFVCKSFFGSGEEQRLATMLPAKLRGRRQRTDCEPDLACLPDRLGRPGIILDRCSDAVLRPTLVRHHVVSSLAPPLIGGESFALSLN